MITDKELKLLGEAIDSIDDFELFNKKLYEANVALDIATGGDGKCHIEERDGKRYYSGPMNADEMERMFMDEHAVLTFY